MIRDLRATIMTTPEPETWISDDKAQGLPGKSQVSDMYWRDLNVMNTEEEREAPCVIRPQPIQAHGSSIPGTVPTNEQHHGRFSWLLLLHTLLKREYRAEQMNLVFNDYYDLFLEAYSSVQT